MWYRAGRSTPLRKFPTRVPSEELGPWTSARFQSQDARDRFLRDVENLGTREVGAEAMRDADEGAWVRWRQGQFLALNDIAYENGGRIVLSVTRVHGV